MRGRLLARMGEMGYVARAVLTGRLCPRRIAAKAENRSGFESGGSFARFGKSRVYDVWFHSSRLKIGRSR